MKKTNKIKEAENMKKNCLKKLCDAEILGMNAEKFDIVARELFSDAYRLTLSFSMARIKDNFVKAEKLLTALHKTLEGSNKIDCVHALTLTLALIVSDKDVMKDMKFSQKTIDRLKDINLSHKEMDNLETSTYIG